MLDFIILEYLAPIAAALITVIAVIADFLPWHNRDGCWRWAGCTMTMRVASTDAKLGNIVRFNSSRSPH